MHRLYGLHQTSRVISKQSELWHKSTFSCLYLESVMYDTIGGLIPMVSTWNGVIRSAVFVSALAMSVELAQTCLGAVVFLNAPAVHMCSNNEASDSARSITCAGRRSPGMYARHTGCPYSCSDCRCSGQNRLFPQRCASSQKQRAYTNIKSNADDISSLLDT